MKRFATRVLSEVDLCIGCNECLEACPLGERDLVTIADLNRAVRSPTVDDAAVRTFVDACTSCGRCVPVCPVDLDRRNMVLLNKAKLLDRRDDARVPYVAVDGALLSGAGATARELGAALGRTRFFGGGVPAAALRHLAAGGALLRLERGQQLHAQGAWAGRVFVVVRGSLASRANTTKGPVDLVRLGPGDLAGVVSVIGDRPEPYDLVAVDDSEVLCLHKEVLLAQMQMYAELRERVLELVRTRGLEALVRRLPGFQPMGEAELADVLERGTVEPLDAGDVLWEVGRSVTQVAVIVRGFLAAVDATSDGVFDYPGEGVALGRGALLAAHAGRSWPAPVRVRALSAAEVWTIPVTTLARALSRKGWEQVLSVPFPEDGWGRGGMRPAAGTVDDGGTGDGFRSNPTGVRDGRDVLVIDQRRCTDCDACADACASRHGVARLVREGPVNGPFLFPGSCHHCADPACLLCSVQGIVRAPGGEIEIRPEACIGCGECAARCPWDAIHLQPRGGEAAPRPGLVARIGHLLVPTSARESEPFRWLADALGLPELPTRGAPERLAVGEHVAVKCDLCAGYTDHACVKACPTAAIARVSPTWEDEA